MSLTIGRKNSLQATNYNQTQMEVTTDDDDNTEPRTATQEQLSLEETLAAVEKIYQTTTVN